MCCQKECVSMSYCLCKLNTVKLRYNVFLGTVKNGTLYPRYVITTKERSSYFIINPNAVNQDASSLLYSTLLLS